MKKEKMITPVNFKVSDKSKVCIHCKTEKPAESFNGFNRICNSCKSIAKVGMQSITVGRTMKPTVKFMDEKHSNNRIKQANRTHEKTAVLPEKTVKVKLKTEDKFGRTNKIVGKNWDKQLAEIKLRIKSL
jgi:NAD-dependent SIR2 family protein deacetylase